MRTPSPTGPAVPRWSGRACFVPRRPMSTLTVSDIPLDRDGPAQRLRRLAAAVRVTLHWWGVHRALPPQQREEIGSAAAADARFLTAGKKLVDVRHEAFRRL